MRYSDCPEFSEIIGFFLLRRRIDARIHAENSFSVAKLVALLFCAF
ncbi:hypothetical protein [Psychromarinibacter sp. S121]